MTIRITFGTPACFNNRRKTASAIVLSSTHVADSQSLSCQYDAHRKRRCRGCPKIDHAHHGIEAPSHVAPANSHRSILISFVQIVGKQSTVNSSRSPFKQTGRSSPSGTRGLPSLTAVLPRDRKTDCQSFAVQSNPPHAILDAIARPPSRLQ